MTDLILEGEATPPTLEQWLIDYGKDYNDKLTPEMAQKAIDEGYFFDLGGNFTDKGLDLLAGEKVILRKITIITLGRTISAYDNKNRKISIREGSQVLVLFSGQNSKNKLWWDDIQVGDAFPTLRLYRSKSDTRSEHRWPVNWPMTGRYVSP